MPPINKKEITASELTAALTAMGLTWYFCCFVLSKAYSLLFNDILSLFSDKLISDLVIKEASQIFAFSIVIALVATLLMSYLLSRQTFPITIYIVSFVNKNFIGSLAIIITFIVCYSLPLFFISQITPATQKIIFLFSAGLFLFIICLLLLFNRTPTRLCLFTLMFFVVMLGTTAIYITVGFDKAEKNRYIIYTNLKDHPAFSSQDVSVFGNILRIDKSSIYIPAASITYIKKITELESPPLPE